MTLIPHDESDRQRLEELTRGEDDAKQRDRYRVVLLALAAEGAEEREGDEIAEMLGRSPRFVDEWAGRYRRGGIAALAPKKQPGRKRKLAAEQEQKLKERLDAGATEADGVCVLRGRDIVRILEREFGVKHTLGGIYGVLRRLGFSSLSPRPEHEENDPAAIEKFKQDAPFFSTP